MNPRTPSPAKSCACEPSTNSSVWPPTSPRPPGQPCLDRDVVRRIGNRFCIISWFDDGTTHGQCVCIYKVPGTLSGDILRLKRNLPDVAGHYKIDRRRDPPPRPPPWIVQRNWKTIPRM